MMDIESTDNDAEREGAGPAEPPAGEREADPAANPGPRGNPDPDPERIDRDREDLERTGAN